MAEDENIERLLSSTFASVGLTEKQLNELQRRGPIQRLLGMLVLLGAAGITLYIGPTEAIVFATLAIAGVWLLPTGRKLFRLEEGAFVLRDQFGKIRFMAALNEESNPVMLFHDREGKQRIGLALTEDGSPAVLLSDGQRERLALVVSQETPVLFMPIERRDGLGDRPFGFFITVKKADGKNTPELVLENEDGETVITSGMAGFKDSKHLVAITGRGAAEVHCRRGEEGVTCGIGEDEQLPRGITAQSPDAMMAAGIIDHKVAQMFLRSGEHFAIAATRPDSTVVWVKDGDAPERNVFRSPRAEA